MLEIKLKRTVKVDVWHILGTIAKTTPRPEIHIVLQHIEDNGWTTDEDLAEQLFSAKQGRRVIAQKLLNICQTYHLVQHENGRYILTEEGRDAVNKNEIFVPQKGTWKIWVSNDPMLDHPVLKIEQWDEPDARTEIFGDKKSPKRPFKKLPSSIMALKQNIYQPHVSRSNIRIDNIESKGEMANDKVNLDLLWNVTENKLAAKFLTKTIELSPPAMDLEEVWRQLLTQKGHYKNWDKTQQTLLVSFDETTPAERQSMQKSIRFDNPAFTKLGRFDSIQVDHISVNAQTEGDAQQWATWRFEQSIKTYATQQNFHNWQKQALKPFSRHQNSINLPTRQTLAAQTWLICQQSENRPTSKQWHIVAAEDWRLP